MDKKLIQCKRIENKLLGTIDFVSGDRDGSQLIFRTSRQQEQGKCVFQIGTATPDLAVQAARVVAGDVDSIDINMGCPKHFSVHSGMGVALTRDNERACSIVRALCGASLGIPVSCKIRLRDTVDETVQLVRDLEAAGVQAIGVHARTASMRPKDKPHWHQLRQIVDAVSVPVIVNGNIWGPEEAKEVRALSGCSSVMSARGALKNLRVCFEPDIDVARTEMNDKHSLMRVIHDYVRLAIEYDNHGKNTKYVIQYMLKMNSSLGTTFGKAISSGKTRTMSDIAAVCGLNEYYTQVVATREAAQEALNGGGGGGGGGSGSSISWIPGTDQPNEIAFEKVMDCIHLVFVVVGFIHVRDHIDKGCWVENGCGCLCEGCCCCCLGALVASWHIAGIEKQFGCSCGSAIVAGVRGVFL